MPRSKNNIKRTPIAKIALYSAIKLVKEKKISLRGAAKHFNLSRCTLKRHYEHCLKTGKDASDLHDNLAVKKVFTGDEELLLVDYIQEAAKLQYGLTLKGVKRLAYEFATKNNKKYPAQWDKDQMAGDYWLRLFRKRHEKQLALRKPEATSLARSTAFNKQTVQLTFENYKKALSKCPQLRAIDIWNVDESGISTVHVPPKILAPKGVKQVGAMTSGEKGNTVTMIAAINAGGGFIPPMLIFPRVNFKDFMLVGAPDGTIGGANPSGWSNEALFLQFFKHFIQYVKPSKDYPTILLLDNHESHIQIPVIELARENSVILVTFHPHTSHKFQPLDKTVFGPFKKYYNTAANELMLTPGHVGKPLTIYDIAGLVGKAFPQSFTPSNIIQGFRSAGLHPLNENIFGEHEFMPSNVTDRPFPVCENEPHAGTSSEETNEILEQHLPGESTQKCKEVLETSLQENTPGCSNVVTPSMIRPHPKAEPRKEVRKGRQKGKSRILTDTPEKIEIERIKAARQNKKLKIDKKVKVQKLKVKKKILKEESETSEDEHESFSVRDSDVSEGFLSSEEEPLTNYSEGNKENRHANNFEDGDYVIFIYEGEYFVGQIVSGNKEGALIKSMKKSLKNWKWPEKEDLNLYQWLDIKEKIKSPKKTNSKREYYSVPEMNKYSEFID